MSKTNLRYPLFIAAIGLLVLTQAHAGTPVWTYSAPSPATTTVSAGSTATVQYTVTNQSNKSKNLILIATPGLSASSCYLATKGSTCTLTLTVNGSAVPREGIHTGPVLCDQGNPNQCYRPNQGNELRITLSPITTYTVTASGDTHVSAAPATQNITSGSTGTVNLTVTTGYTAAIASDTCGGSLSGNTYTTGAVTSNCSVNFSSRQTEATLTVTPSTLALSVIGLTTTTGNDSGTPRIFTIANTGPDAATGIVCPTSNSPSITSIVCTGCDNLANGDTCTVTITPTVTPSAAGAALTRSRAPVGASNKIKILRVICYQ